MRHSEEVCPNPKGNPKCNKYRQLKAPFCRSCAHFGKPHSTTHCANFAAARARPFRKNALSEGLVWKDTDGYGCRRCPSTKGNSNCKGLIRYDSVDLALRAEKGGDVCKRCARLGAKHTEESRRLMSLSHTGAKDSEETRRKKSAAQQGERNNFFGKKHTAKSIERISKSQRGKKASEESKQKMSLSHKGKKPSPEALKRQIERQRSPEYRAKLSARMAGENNPFYGRVHTDETRAKIARNSRPSYGVSGWYKGLHFRSSCELNFLWTNKNAEWKSAERKKFCISYVDRHGKSRRYFPDFFGNNELIEIKPIGWKGDPRQAGFSLKILPARVFAAQRSWWYRIVEMPSMSKNSIFALRKGSEISLEPVWEEKYQTWLRKQEPVAAVSG